MLLTFISVDKNLFKIKKKQLYEKAKSEQDKIMKIGESAIRQDIIYNSNTKFSFKKLKTIKTLW